MLKFKKEIAEITLGLSDYNNLKVHLEEKEFNPIINKFKKDLVKKLGINIKSKLAEDIIQSSNDFIFSC